MITRIKSHKIITPHALLDGWVYFDGSTISAVTSESLPFDQEFDAGDSYVSPGFLDIHTHGGAGHDFSGTVEDIIAGVNFHLSHGTTSICPTVSAAPFPVMAAAVKNIALAKTDARAKANILGAHMEGPYLSAEQCGAQCPDYITPPKPEDYIPLIEAYKHAIARVTLAPENDPDLAFCRYLSKQGIVVSAGHTNATGDELNRAVENGCSLVTHLYSCCSTVTRDHGFRRLGVIETALLRDDLYAEIIADGKHLPPELIRLILKAKGIDKVALVTDSLHLAGTDIKTGRMMATDFIIEDGVCKLLDRSAFAGSIATADRLVRVMREEVGISLLDAVPMITEVPAKIMRVNKGVLAKGYDADLLVFDEQIHMQHIWVMGQKVTL